MQMFACLKEHMGEVIDYVFCALYMICPGSAVSWNRQDCNGQSIQRVQNTWSVGTAWSVFKCSHTNVVFQTAIFLILVVRSNKCSSQVLTAKPATAFPEIVHITVELRFRS